MNPSLPVLKVNRNNLSPFLSCENFSISINIPLDKLEYISQNSKKMYGYFPRPKKSGGTRPINPPNITLSAIQRILLEMFYLCFKFPSYIIGGIPGCSNNDHAKKHLCKQMVATMDLNDFFPNTNPDKIRPVLLNHGINEQVANLIIGLTSYKNGLPQGAPTSMFLANMVFAQTDILIVRLANRHKLKYSRYVDDIAISGNCDFRFIKGPISEIIINSGYILRPDKTFFIPQSQRQVVTGLVVNNKLKPIKEWYDTLKQNIEDCYENGIDFVADQEGLKPHKLIRALYYRIYPHDENHPFASEVVTVFNASRIAS
jgi:RNA-directed DNA polymerase